MSKKACLDETRELKKPGAYYLTDIDVTYPIDVIPPDYRDYLSDDSYETGYMNGHSAGMADGMNLIERAKND